MKGICSKLLSVLVSLLAPRVTEKVVEALEELVKVDLNKDGVIGFTQGSEVKADVIPFGTESK